jgi:hypothetical protein
MAAHNDNHRTWTPGAVRELGLTTDLPTAAQIIGIGRSLAYDLAKTGQFPVRILRIRGRVLVPVPDLLRYVGASSEANKDGSGHKT